MLFTDRKTLTKRQRQILWTMAGIAGTTLIIYLIKRFSSDIENPSIQSLCSSQKDHVISELDLLKIPRPDNEEEYGNVLAQLLTVHRANIPVWLIEVFDEYYHPEFKYV